MTKWMCLPLVLAIGCKNKDAPAGDPKSVDKPAEKPADKPAEKPADKPADKPAAAPCPDGAFTNADPHFCIKLPAGYALKEGYPKDGSLGKEFRFYNKDTSQDFEVDVMKDTSGYKVDVETLPRSIDEKHFEVLGKGITPTGGEFLHYKEKSGGSVYLKAYWKGAKNEFSCVIDAMGKDHAKPDVIDACKTMKVD